MKFEKAIKAMKEGKKVTRPHWNTYIFGSNVIKRRRENDDAIIDIPLDIKDFEATDWQFKGFTREGNYTGTLTYQRRDTIIREMN